MTNYLSLTMLEINKLLKEKTILPIDLINEFIEKIKKDSNILITIDEEAAMKKAKQLEKEEIESILYGIPIVVSDNIVTKDVQTTAGSKILENFIPVYDAFVIKKLKEKQAIIIAKANLNEFGLNNDIDNNGSELSIIKNYSPISLATNYIDNNTVVRMKPTYGKISKYGVILSNSSFEQVTPVSRSVIDNAILLDAISGFDELDITTSKTTLNLQKLEESIINKKIAIPSYYLNKDLSLEIIEKLKEKSFIIEYLDLPYIHYLNSIYNIINSAETCSNLSRYDGLKFGLSKNGKTYKEIIKNTRTAGFSLKTKKTIIKGMSILSKDNKEHYYKALSLRRSIINDYKKILEKYDFIITLNNDEIINKLSSIIGAPSLTLPSKYGNLNIISSWFNEKSIYQLGLLINTLEVGDE